MGKSATRSEELITRARRLARECGGCEISAAVFELCREIEKPKRGDMQISDLIKRAHDASIKKGFYPEGEKRNIGEILMLIVSELGEALEADRKFHHINIKLWDQVHVYDLDPSTNPQFAFDFETHVKDTFEDEIADAVIRIGDLCGYLGIDLESHIIAKMQYNETRPAKHGKAY
jgi:NTP pyrophosphatase (non-canonical NTP hydrolase)